MPKTIIIGAGIGGLTAALSYSLLGHEVLVIDCRREYSRDQLIFFPSDLIEKCYELSDLRKFGVKMFFNEEGSFGLNYLPHFKEPDSDFDLDFFRLLEKNDRVIEIKDFQNYQIRKLKSLMKKKEFFLTDDDAFEEMHYSQEKSQAFYHLIENAPAPVPTSFQRQILRQLHKDEDALVPSKFRITGKISFLMDPKYQVVDIDAQHQILLLDEAGVLKKIEFDNLVGADGANHKMADLLLRSNPSLKLPLKSLAEPRHNAYAQGRFTINLSDEAFEEIHNYVTAERNAGLSLSITQHSHARLGLHLCVEHREMLKKMGWEEKYLPFVFLATDKAKKECYITGEIPRGLKATADKSKDVKTQVELAEWFSTVLFCLIGIEQSKLNWLRGGIFQVNTLCFEKNHITLGLGGKFILVGDAFLPANFLYGHGVKSAIQDGSVIYDCYDEEGDEFDPQPLDSWAMMRVEEYNYYRELIESSRVMLEPMVGPMPIINTVISTEGCQRFYKNLHSQSYMREQNDSLLRNGIDNAPRELAWLKNMKEVQENQERESFKAKNPNAFALIISKKHSSVR